MPCRSPVSPVLLFLEVDVCMIVGGLSQAAQKVVDVHGECLLLSTMHCSPVCRMVQARYRLLSGSVVDTLATRLRLFTCQR